MSGLMWIQAVLHFDGIAEEILNSLISFIF